MDVVIKSLKIKKRSVRDLRVRWLNLTRESATKLSEKIKAEESNKQVQDLNTMWKAKVECIPRLAEEVLGISKGGRGRIKGAWWRGEDVKEKVKEKHDVYAALIDTS